MTASNTTRQEAAADRRTELFAIVAADGGPHHGGRPAEHIVIRSASAVTATDLTAAWTLVGSTDFVRVTLNLTE